jgi:hypothetical protein
MPCWNLQVGDQGLDSAGFQFLIYATGTKLVLDAVHTYCTTTVEKYMCKVSESRRRGTR